MPQNNKIKIRRGLDVDLPLPNTEEGELRYSKDTQKLYIDDGINNVYIGGNTDNLPISTATQTALNGKEPIIPTGTSLQYIKGDKTLETFPTIPTVDQTIIDGSTNAVSGNAVFDGLALKANLSGGNSFTGNQQFTGDISTSGLAIANTLNLASISENSTNGFILKNSQPFIHNFYAGTNPVTGGTGKNTFVGLNSGNFNADNFTYASTMLGFESGMSNKNGYSNTGIGYYALKLNENGYGNTALGTFVLGNAINSNQNTSVGWHSMLYRTGGSSNTGVGVDVLKENLEGNFNTAFGANAGANNVSGNLNVFLGYAAGFNELGSGKLYISNSSTSDPLLKGDFASNSLSLGAGTGNKVDFYGVGSIAKIDYRNHANSLIPIIHDASGHTFNLNGSPSLTLNGVGAAVGLSSGNINKFEVLVASSTGGSGVNGIAVHDGQVNRMALLSGVNTASSYSWIQSTKGGVGSRPIFLNPNGGGVSIGNTTDAGTGNINIAGKATAGSPATVANDLMRKGETDTALALKANLASPAFTGTPTAPTPTAGTNTTQVANAAFVAGAVAAADASNVKLTGNQTIVGTKTFSSPVIIPNGVNPNEGVNKGQLDAVGRPYKVYTALLTQTGTNAPTATVLENTLDGTVVLARNNVGSYTAILAGAWIGGKTFAVATQGASGSIGSSIRASRRTTADLDIFTYNSSNVLSDNIIDNNATLEIRVYN